MSLRELALIDNRPFGFEVRRERTLLGSRIQALEAELEAYRERPSELVKANMTLKRSLDDCKRQNDVLVGTVRRIKPIERRSGCGLESRTLRSKDRCRINIVLISQFHGFLVEFSAGPDLNEQSGTFYLDPDCSYTCGSHGVTIIEEALAIAQRPFEL